MLSPWLKLVIRLVYEIYSGAIVAGANVMESYIRIINIYDTNTLIELHFLFEHIMYNLNSSEV